MTDLQKLWREKADREVAHAGGRLEEYTENGQRVIRQELARPSTCPKA